MNTKTLWLDNDPAWIKSYVEAMENSGYDVEVVTSVGEAENRINEKKYGLVILDVMIPTKSQEEEEYYKPDETDFGAKTGLIFYRRMKKKLAKTATSILVTTVRIDRKIQQAFLEEGLPS